MCGRPPWKHGYCWLDGVPPRHWTPPGCLTHLGVGRQLQAELELFTGAQQPLTRRDCHCAHVCLRPQELQDTGWAYCLVRLPDGAGSTQSSNPESWTGLGASRKTKTTTITTT